MLNGVYWEGGDEGWQTISKKLQNRIPMTKFERIHQRFLRYTPRKGRRSRVSVRDFGRLWGIELKAWCEIALPLRRPRGLVFYMGRTIKDYGRNLVVGVYEPST